MWTSFWVGDFRLETFWGQDQDQHFNCCFLLKNSRTPAPAGGFSNRISDSSTSCIFVVTLDQFSILKQSEGNVAILIDKTKPACLAVLLRGSCSCVFRYWGKVDAFWWALNIKSHCLLELSSAEIDFSTWSAAADWKWLVRGDYSQVHPDFCFWLITFLLALLTALRGSSHVCCLSVQTVQSRDLGLNNLLPQKQACLQTAWMSQRVNVTPRVGSQCFSKSCSRYFCLYSAESLLCWTLSTQNLALRFGRPCAVVWCHLLC